MVDHILFPTEFSDNAEQAFSTVKGLVANGAKHLTLLHVQEKERISRHLASDILARARKGYISLEVEGVIRPQDVCYKVLRDHSSAMEQNQITPRSCCSGPAPKNFADAHAGLKDQQRLHQASVETLADPKMTTLVVAGRHAPGGDARPADRPHPAQRGAREPRAGSPGAARGGVNDDAGL
jgi:hypothetical protein